MKTQFYWGAGALCLMVALCPAYGQDSEASALKDVIVVSGTRLSPAKEVLVTPEAVPLEGSDLTYVTARLPGGARIGNGEMSGQMAYRGLFGERLNLRVDGQRFASGGPNLMDPVFHYAPAPLIAAVEVDRGVSPVSDGPGLGGGANAVFKKIDFTDSDVPVYGYDLSLGGRSVNDSYSVGGVAGASTSRWRLNALGAYETGSDTEFADGTIGGTEFERGVFGVSSGLRFGETELSLDLRRQNTGPSGNPPFGMDIIYVDTDFMKFGVTTLVGAVRLEAALSYSDVAHLMDNNQLREAPADMSKYRATTTTAQTKGAEVKASLAAFGGEFSFGVDADRAEHDAIIRNPNNEMFFVTPFPDINMDRKGGYAEWTGAMGPMSAELGLRVDQYDYEAGAARLASMLPSGAQMLASRFNAAQTDGEDTTWDAVARFWASGPGDVTLRATLAHKQKVPGYIQRFGWLPISASGGLADGNIYVGNLELEPEAAVIVEAGVDYIGPTAYIRPTLFVRDIQNYVQGTPYDDTIGVADSPVEMVASMNGDSTPLMWRNVDARLYGIDADMGVDFAGPLRVDAVASYVRGERQDIDDDLYRIAPPSLTTSLTWEAERWSTTFEVRAVAEQEKVSVTNDETASDAYAVATLYGDVKLKDGMSLSLGVENLFDETYRDHLSGINRNGFGDVTQGERVPGAGRGLFIRLNMIR